MLPQCAVRIRLIKAAPRDLRIVRSHRIVQCLDHLRMRRIVRIDEDDPLLNLNQEHLCDLVTWMFEKNGENQTRIGESRNLNRLNKILDPRYTKALDAFKSGTSLSAAADLTDEADEIVSKKISESLEAIKIAWSYFPSIKDFGSIDQEQIKDINRTAAAFYKSLVAKMTSEFGLEDVD